MGWQHDDPAPTVIDWLDDLYAEHPVILTLACIVIFAIAALLSGR